MAQSYRRQAIALIATLMIAPGLQAQSDRIEGLLAVGSRHSALMTISAQTGDLVGYFFRNASEVGKSLLQRCLPELYCRVEGVRLTQPMIDRPAVPIDDEPSGWWQVVDARNATMVSEFTATRASSPTRFGTLAVDSEALRLNGKLLVPAVPVHGQTSILETYPVRAQDLVLIRESGDAECPVRFRWIALDGQRARATSPFGTCSDVIRVQQKEAETLELYMPERWIASSIPNDPNRVPVLVTYTYERGRLTQTKTPTR